MNERRPALRLGLVLGASLALGACASYSGLEPAGQRLDPAGLAAGDSLAGHAVGPAAWPRQDWWTRLGDAQLDGLIGEALAGSPDLAAAAARTRKALADTQVRDADRQPGVNASAGYSGASAPESVVPAPIGGHYAGIKYLSLSFNYDLDLWGGRRAAWEAALGKARAAEVDQQAARLTLSVDIARAYNQLAYAFVARDLAAEEVKRAEQLYTLSRQRMAAGLDSKVQLQQSESQRATARQQLLAAEQQIDSDRTTLAVLLGQGPDRGRAIQRPQVLQPAALALPSELPAELLGRRPDVVAARWRVEAASRGIDSAKTGFYPNLNLSAMLGLAALGGDGLFKGDSRFYQVAPALSLPVFDGGRLRAELDGVDADYDLAVAQYNKALVGALGDVSEDLSQLDSLARQIEAQREARDIARSNYDLAMRRYGEGIGNYLDALSVEQQLLVAERQLASLDAQRIDASVRLVQALGGGFHPDSTPLAQAGQPTATE